MSNKQSFAILSAIVLSVIGLVIFSGIQQVQAPQTNLGAPVANLTRDLVPITDSKYFLGTTTPSTVAYLGLVVDEVCLTGDACRTTWPASAGSANYDAFTHVVTGTSATTTEMRFAGGFISQASSTVSQLNVGGLLNASSSALFAASSTFNNSLSVAGLLQLGGGLNASSTATSTFAGGISAAGLILTNGINISSGSFQCTTCIPNASLANSTISGISLGGTLANLTATDSTLTFSGTYTGATARTIGLNLGNSNTWTAAQLFSYTATTTFSGNGVQAKGFDGGFIDVSGQFRLGTGSATSTYGYDPDNGGQLTMATSSDRVVVAQANKQPYALTIPNPSTASSTIPLVGKPYAMNIYSVFCGVVSGTNVVVHLNKSTGASSNSITCTTASTTEYRITQNGTRTLGEPTTLIIESVSGAVNSLYIGVNATTSPQ